MRIATVLNFFSGCLFLVSLAFVSSSAFVLAAEKEQLFTLCTARPAFRTTVLRGYTRARWQRALVCEESGRCLEVVGELGDKIAAGGLFARIDTTFIDLELKANRAARARFENQITYWQHEVERYRSLSGQKAVSEKKVLDLEQYFDQARLALVELVIKAEILEERRRRCRIIAPENWHILNRKAEPGEWLTAGQVVAYVADYNTLLVPFSLTMAQFEWLRHENEKGKLYLQAATNLDHFSESVEIPARLLHISPAFEVESRKILVELEISRGLAESRGGIALGLAIELPEPGAVVAVPANALIERYGAFWLIRESGEEVEVIKLGRTVTGDMKIASDQIKVGDSFRCR